MSAEGCGWTEIVDGAEGIEHVTTNDAGGPIDPTRDQNKRARDQTPSSGYSSVGHQGIRRPRLSRPRSAPSYVHGKGKGTLKILGESVCVGGGGALWLKDGACFVSTNGATCMVTTRA